MHHRDNCKTARSKLFQQLEQRQRAAAIEPAGGLVQEQAERRAGQCDAEADTAALAAADAAIRDG
jgi:hypothetical protein